MTLFEYQNQKQLKSEGPLAYRMRPRIFDELVGQDHIIGPDKVLRKSIESDQLPSIILWGPPGTGKTTLASLIATITRSHFSPISAVDSGVVDLRNSIGSARDRSGMHGQRTILFIDEIHRFNKAQQDVILPHVENGTVTLIGATTENPSFEVNSPLLSRCGVFTLNPLTDEDLSKIISRALTDVDRGLGNLNLILEKESAEFLINMANGDARVALNTLELVASATTEDESGKRHISPSLIEDAIQRRMGGYDKSGDQHFDTISAYIKSLRDSDPDAALYWLARMIDAGEDPMYIARRLVIQAAEDVGMADPQALPVAIAAQQAVHLVGMPEGRIPLAEATVYVATAPKSNSAYTAINAALSDVQNTRNEPVPMHLRNATTGLNKSLGYGKGYRYAHNQEDHFGGMENLPPILNGKRYYIPSGQGLEIEIEARLRKWRAGRNTVE